jgi:hypothetical protein
MTSFENASSKSANGAASVPAPCSGKAKRIPPFGLGRNPSLYSIVVFCSTAIYMRMSSRSWEELLKSVVNPGKTSG